MPISATHQQKKFFLPFYSLIGLARCLPDKPALNSQKSNVTNFLLFYLIADVANNQCMIFFLRKLSNFIFFFRLPDGMVHLRNLTVLGLNDMSLTELPDEFGR